MLICYKTQFMCFRPFLFVFLMKLVVILNARYRGRGVMTNTEISSYNLLLRTL